MRIFSLIAFVMLSCPAWASFDSDEDLTLIAALSAAVGGSVSPWSPLDLPQVELFTDPADNAYLTLESATNVMDMLDKSVNGVTFSAAGEANAPQVSTNYNGKQMLRFNLTRSTTSASYDWLTANDTNFLSFIHLGEPSTVIIIAASSRGTNDLHTIFSSKRGASNQRGIDIFLDHRNSAAKTNGILAQTADRGAIGLTTEWSAPTQTWPADRLNIIELQYHISTNVAATNRLIVRINTDAPIYANTLNFAPTVLSGHDAPVIGAVSVANSNPLKDAFVGPIIVCRAHLNDTHRTLLRAWAADKYGWSP
jgi:hypothetical protein